MPKNPRPAPAGVSLYLPATPTTQDAQDAQADRIAMKNLVRSSLEQPAAMQMDKRKRVPVAEALGDMVEDDEFWRFQARSLAVFASEGATLSFRLRWSGASRRRSWPRRSR
jgi:hypothetical protein